MSGEMPLQRLLEVQNVDLRIKDLEAKTAAIPLRMQECDRSLDSRRAKLDALSREIEEIKKAQRHIERQLEEKQGELAKYNSQLPQIKTNREYKAILVEIDMVEKDISNLEEEILRKMSDVEDVEEKARAEKAEFKQAEEDANKEKEDLTRKREELERFLRETQSQRGNLTEDVEKSLLSKYDTIRTRKDGLALAIVNDESCGACHITLPPQVVNEVIGGKVKTCPSCSRLLYWDEEESVN